MNRVRTSTWIVLALSMTAFFLSTYDSTLTIIFAVTAIVLAVWNFTRDT